MMGTLLPLSLALSPRARAGRVTDGCNEVRLGREGFKFLFLSWATHLSSSIFFIFTVEVLQWRCLVNYVEALSKL